MKDTWLAVVLAALMLGTFLRAHNLGALHPFEADERLWLLVGTSLWREGEPASWTIYWDQYERIEKRIYGGREHIVAVPFVDHPPLFAIGMGGWAIVTGNDSVSSLNWAVLRAPMIGLAGGTMVVLWLWMKKLFDEAGAGITVTALALFPAHIIASRFIVAEQLIAFLLIAGLYAFASLDTAENVSGRRVKMAKLALALICAAALLIKLSAIVIPATIGLLALLKKNYGILRITILATVLSLTALLLYGGYYDWNIFVEVLGGHTGRPQSFWHFWSIITQLDLGYLPWRDPAIIIGFIGLFTLLADKKIPWEKRLYVFAPLLNFSLLFLFVAPVEAYGWYKYALFPLLAVGLGYVLTELWRGKVVYSALVLPAIALVMENSGFLASHEQRRWLMLFLYGLVAAGWLFARYRPEKRKFLQATLQVLVLSLLWLDLTWVKVVLG